jgi:O-antigen ligase
MTSDRKMPFYIVLFACVLVVLGDLRNAITPLGYWALWGVILFIGAFTASVRKIQYDAAFFSVSCGFAILIFAIFVASIVNGDVTTAYQGLKYIIIYAILIVVYSNSQYLQLNQFYTISAISTLVGLLVFLFTKYIISDYFIILGDGRQGSLVAYPGVLWKTNAFFVAFIIARMLSNPTRNLIPTVFVFLSSVYLLLADSSRTGFLWLAVIVTAFALLVFVANTARFLSVSSVLVLLVGVISVFNLDAIYGFVDSNSLLVVNRLFEGDPIRAKMITDGIVNADACLPLGCGFQTSTSLVDGAPMVIHNVYLAILGDYGALGELGLLIIVVSPVIVFVMREWTSGSTKTPLVFYKLAAYLGAACYCFILLFHPLSSEMSEWGYWAIMLSWLSRLSNKKQAANITSDLRARF